MYEFENRVVQYPNSSTLRVNSVLVDSSGKIREMEVDTRRSEGTIEKKGTPLNAQTFNELLVKKFYELMFGIDLGKLFGLKMGQNKEKYSSITCKLSISQPLLYAKEYSDQYLRIEGTTSQDGYITLTITEQLPLAQLTGAMRLIPFTVSLYSDVNLLHFVTNINGVLEYIPTSTDVND